MANTVFITGGTRGIGRAAALAFAAAGWRVGFCYLSSEAEAHSLISHFAQEGAMAEAVQGDVASAADARRMIDQIEKSLGPISALINNAGVSCDSEFLATTPEMWDLTFKTNVSGAYNVINAALPGMLSRQRGSVINVSSVWGVYGGSCEAAYSASKAALIGLTKALAKEFGPSGIRFNCVCPGVINTDMLSRLSAEEREELARRTPLCRLGEPEEVAEALVFLASPAARFITGQALGIDGGFNG